MDAKRIPCEIYSRVVGYYRPVQNWNPGKRQEFRERRPYDLRSLLERVEAEEPHDLGVGSV